MYTILHILLVALILHLYEQNFNNNGDIFLTENNTH